MESERLVAAQLKKMGAADRGRFRVFPESFSENRIRWRIPIVRKMTLGTRIASEVISRNTRPQLPGSGCPRAKRCSTMNKESSMLVLSRKVGERIHVGDNITIEIRRIAGNRVTIALGRLVTYGSCAVN